MLKSEMHLDWSPFVEAELDPVEPDVKEAPVTPIAPMDEGQPTGLQNPGAQANHPQVGQTGADQQPRQMRRVRDVTACQIKPTALLV